MTIKKQTGPIPVRNFDQDFGLDNRKTFILFGEEHLVVDSQSPYFLAAMLQVQVKIEEARAGGEIDASGVVSSLNAAQYRAGIDAMVDMLVAAAPSLETHRGQLSTLSIERLQTISEYCGIDMGAAPDTAGAEGGGDTAGKS